MNTDRLRSNLDAIREQMVRSAERSGRDPRSVRLVVVTKQTTAAAAEALVQQGEFDLGENYPQELWRKAEALSGYPVRWHLIGHLQSNKARRTFPLVRMIHAVDSLKLLQILDELAAHQPDPASVCLQVNCSGEASKHGWEPAALLDEAGGIAACQSVPIVGLMTMAAYSDDPEAARPAFRLLRQTRDALQDRIGRALPELSMGMSNDYQVAIEEGATWIRVGSAVWEGVEA
ncbi:MAG: YggS family pyridoxal phosphate enzyme [Isosphaeraceae bacterium]|jgi:pyridoxal phosphate enzyme (YggS family)|nr:MAG: YggS family pyridoxal phosphate enzyme [Isosphaeraceae bacterium]